MLNVPYVINVYYCAILILSITAEYISYCKQKKKSSILNVFGIKSIKVASISRIPSEY